MKRVISFCTTVKNRTWQLKQTLPSNIKYINSFPNTKILILNYNTEDDLTDYLFSNFKKELENGKIEYYILEDRLQGFDMSLAKNLIHLQAKEGVVFNLDADNFINDLLIHELKTLPDNTILLPKQSSEYSHKHYKDTGRCGRLGMSFSTYLAIGGYDESIKGLGADDGNIVMRGHAKGCRLQTSEELSLPIANEQEALEKNMHPINGGTMDANKNGFGKNKVYRFKV